MNAAQLERARKLLCALQDSIRDALAAARAQSAHRFAKVAAVTAADTIYEVDRISEEVVMEWFTAHWPRAWPVELVMEGIADGETVTFPKNTPVEKTKYKCILDPIDGTRNIMYDKRSAWTLAGLAPQRGAKNTLADITVAAMTELGTTKMVRSDQLSAIRGCGVTARTLDLRTRRWTKLNLLPSRADNFEHGFASLVRFFPPGKALLATVEEELWRELGAVEVFDDQYLTTGGQIYEIVVGHDRMLGDLRPLAFTKLGLSSSLCCHPYDICIELILREAGGIVEAPEGGPLRAPLDTTSPVAWMGYANAKLARQVRPVLRRLITQRLS